MIENAPQPGETPETQLKRLKMRSSRRGIKEMDVILGGFATHGLARLTAEEIALYEALLLENDQDLYTWFSGRAPVPARHARIVARVQDAGHSN